MVSKFKTGLFFVNFFLFFSLLGCSQNSSLNTASYSDNKTFIENNYQSKEPISPFGNLSRDAYGKEHGVAYYENYIQDGMYHLEQNDEYLLWLYSQREKRLKQGKLNGFKQESMPAYNKYYIDKTRNIKGKNIKVSEMIYFDIDRQIQNTKQKQEGEDLGRENHDITNYKIKNNVEGGGGEYESISSDEYSNF